MPALLLIRFNFLLALPEDTASNLQHELDERDLGEVDIWPHQKVNKDHEKLLAPVL